MSLNVFCYIHLFMLHIYTSCSDAYTFVSTTYMCITGRIIKDNLRTFLTVRSLTSQSAKPLYLVVTTLMSFPALKGLSRSLFQYCSHLRCNHTDITCKKVQSYEGKGICKKKCKDKTHLDGYILHTSIMRYEDVGKVKIVAYNNMQNGCILQILVNCNDSYTIQTFPFSSTFVNMMTTVGLCSITICQKIETSSSLGPVKEGRGYSLTMLKDSCSKCNSTSYIRNVAWYLGTVTLRLLL